MDKSFAELMATMSHTRLRFWLVTEAREDWQPGILLEPLVRQSKLAEEKYRSAVGFDAPGVNAVLTKSR
jgi:hypothetical protein